MSPQLTPAEFGNAIEQALQNYDATDATEVSRRVRESAGRDSAIDELLKLYQEVIAEYANAPREREAEAHAAAAYVRDLSLGYSRQRESIFNSTTFRIGERLRRTPGVGRLTRSLARRLVGKRDD